MAAPEFLAIDPDAFIDACAQDVWSIGCLIYRMLTGCMAWESEGSSIQFVMGILQAHRQWVSTACTSWYHLSLHLWPVNLNFHSMAKAALCNCDLLQAQQTPRLSLLLAKLMLFVCCCQNLVRKHCSAAICNIAAFMDDLYMLAVVAQHKATRVSFIGVMQLICLACLQAHALSLPCNHPERLKHPVMQNLQWFSAIDGTNTLSELMQRMLHPDCTQRATLQEVLASGFFPPASSEMEQE